MKFVQADFLYFIHNQKRGKFYMNYWKETKGAIIAGLMIAIGGIINLSCINEGYPILGAFLFCIGLFTICAFKGNLYTGKVGLIPFAYIKDAWGQKDFSLKAKFQFSLTVFHYLIINLITTFGIGFIVGKYYPNLAATAKEIYLPKMESDLIKIFISAFFCGVLMFIAVFCWNRYDIKGILLCVPTFILSGFDHSIANSFYNGVAYGEHTWTMENFWLTIIVILGNAAGSIIFALLRKEQILNS